MHRFFLALLLIAATACSDKSVRYLVEPGPAGRQVAVGVRSVEVRDVVLPTYAEASEMMQARADGGLGTIKDAVWADSTSQALTQLLAASLGLRARAEVAAEPWPLDQPAEARLEVRIERMLPQPDGNFVLSGQYAVSSPDGRLREFLHRFSISVPLEGQGPPAIARAKGQAVDRLADDIVTRLHR